MKRYYLNDVDGDYTLVVGNDREIRSLYKTLERHGFCPTFANTPKFRPGGMYGLILEADNWYHVVNADTVIKLMMED